MNLKRKLKQKRKVWKYWIKQSEYGELSCMYNDMSPEEAKQQGFYFKIEGPSNVHVGWCVESRRFRIK